MLTYPALYHLNAIWEVVPGGARGFGIYMGSTIHEVAQVVAAARSTVQEAADTALITKMVRVMMLAPFLLGLSFALRHEEDGQLPGKGVRGPAIPWFAFGFVAAVLFSSLRLLPVSVISLVTLIDTGVLAMAMAALGMTTRFRSLRAAGTGPLVLATLLFAWLVCAGALINRYVHGILG